MDMHGTAADPSLAQRLRQAAAGMQGERVALAELAQAHGPAAQGTLLVLLSAACLLPLPGVGTVLGLGLLAMVMPLWRGQGGGTLPPRVAGFQMPRPSAQKLLGLLARFYEAAARLARPRRSPLPGLGHRGWLAAKTGWMAAIIILPLPLGNVLPALALVLLGLGLVFRDGLALLLSTTLAALATAYTAALGVAAWQLGMGSLQHWPALRAWVGL